MATKNKFKIAVSQLQSILFLYQTGSVDHKISLLKLMSKMKLNNDNLLQYHECLLFMSTYSESPIILKLTQGELKRIAIWIKKLPLNRLFFFNDSGLPYTIMLTRFSCDMLHVMQQQFKLNIEIDSFEETGESLNTALNITLPDVLKQETTAGLDNIELLNLLGVKPKERLTFLLSELNKLASQPLLKDYLWESIKIYLNISSNELSYSRSFNKLKLNNYYFQNELLKKFDHVALLNAELPVPAKLSDSDRIEVIAVIRKSLLLTMRETDTATYMDESSLLLFHLERGVSIALYGLMPNRQLAYQSYIGYTAFKNGFPVAYGGSWVFGHSAMFGLNILESFRGGESGFIMCQLLRTYIQYFKLNYIEVENYQFGKDNPDGIKSGAFWFYYRYGFRPIDKTLNKLADKEFDKIKKVKNYRSSEKTLVALSESNIAINFNNQTPVKKEAIFTKVLQMIAKDFAGNNLEATKVAIEEFKDKLQIKTTFIDHEYIVLQEVALWAKAFEINDKERLNLLFRMIKIKGKNAITYNELIKSYTSIVV